ncbi:MAG: hypothetical protein DWI23_04945 [Planctomycetota bacterium]|nr:MAG: hypothetical protein DWI23_04945 [Planctomycetota bacterium]
MPFLWVEENIFHITSCQAMRRECGKDGGNVTSVGGSLQRQNVREKDAPVDGAAACGSAD